MKSARNYKSPPEWLQINGQSLINSGLTNEDGSVTGLALLAAPADAPVPLNVSSATVQNYSFQTNLLQEVHLAIIDANSGQDLTAQTNTVIVGQQMNWYAQLSITNQFMTNFLLTNFQWTVQGTTFSNYVADSSTGILNTNFFTTSSNVLFCWSDSGLKKVQLSATVDGKTVTGQAWFNVLRPTANVTTTTGTVAIDNSWGDLEVDFGQKQSSGIGNGIVFSGTVTMPQGYSGNTNYTLEWIQFVNSGSFLTITTQGSTNKIIHSNQPIGLDTSYPYTDVISNNMVAWDAPGITLSVEPNEIAVSDTNSFKMWLMFQPSNGQWVPLRTISWNWSGAATNSGVAWSLTSSSHSTNPPDADAGTTYPIWTNNAATVPWTPPF